MRLEISDKARKQLKKLPLSIRNKVKKSFKYLIVNPSHPSLHVKKMKGLDRWEARIDRSYRFTFYKREDYLYIRTLGPHDTGLGKK